MLEVISLLYNGASLYMFFQDFGGQISSFLLEFLQVKSSNKVIEFNLQHIVRLKQQFSFFIFFSSSVFVCWARMPNPECWIVKTYLAVFYHFNMTCFQCCQKGWHKSSQTFSKSSPKSSHPKNPVENQFSTGFSKLYFELLLKADSKPV